MTNPTPEARIFRKRQNDLRNRELSASGGSLSTIRSDALQAQTTSKTGRSPTLQDTLQWMHSAFPDSQSAYAASVGETREFNFRENPSTKTPSCTATMVEHWKADGQPMTRDTIIDLSLIDPESIKSYTDDTLEKDDGELVIVTTNDKKVIVEKMESRSNEATKTS